MTRDIAIQTFPPITDTSDSHEYFKLAIDKVVDKALNTIRRYEENLLAQQSQIQTLNREISRLREVVDTLTPATPQLNPTTRLPTTANILTSFATPQKRRNNNKDGPVRRAKKRAKYEQKFGLNTPPNCEH